ncbi:MAG: DNA ligase D [Alphaproteobacteria bacterium]|nr:DNA ligase D [Alphaproteobacteria bacterium]
MGKIDTLLKDYKKKRDFAVTPEPEGAAGQERGQRYLIQKHDATRLHFDFRLELDGVLKSWAVTKGPSLTPSDKRLAVRTEDHPVEYAGFEGVIPKGYGAGTVMLWDKGEWEPKEDPKKGLEKGELKFTLHGERLKGGWALIRMSDKGEKRENWLLIKEKDEHADEDTDPVETWTESVETGRDLEAISNEGERYKKGKDYSGKPPAKRTPPRKDAKATGKPPDFTEPQLATLRDEPPEGADWLHEVKYDGYRLQALIGGGKVRLVTRNGKAWTDRYSPIADALASLDVDSAAIDGELVAVDEAGRSDFSALQRAGEGDVALAYFAFDLLSLNGTDLKKEPLKARKTALKACLGKADGPIRYSEHIEGQGDEVIARACDMHLEGIISKKLDAPYRSGRGSGWIKSKCVGNDEFVLIGYRKSDKKGRPFASLLLGEYEGETLKYRGRVGTGFDEALFDSLSKKMKRLERKTPPVEDLPADAKRGAVWLTPDLVAQIAYTERTADGVLRHPSFLGLREDKPAKEVKMPASGDGTATICGVRITHPDRVMYPGQGATKRAIAEYYAAHADRILEHVKDRPLSLIRCPSGRDGECFFQKHHNASTPHALKTVEIREKDGGKASYLKITDAAGLVGAAQIGGLELHVWGALADKVEEPERIVFDLDPDEGYDFGDLKTAARELRDVLGAMGLESFPLLTGGKGIHVIVPIERRNSWDEVKGFAKGLATKLAEADPDRYVAQASKAKRKGKIFIDWLRNERGATAIAPYSPRARENAPVATPVSWGELSRIKAANQFTLDNIDARLKRLKSDPWEGYDTVRQSLTKARLDAVG